MSTHEHEHDPVEPPVLDDYGPPDPEELTLSAHAENLDQEPVSERGDLVPPETPAEELNEQLAPDINGPDAGFPELDEGAEGVPEAVKARTARTTSRLWVGRWGGVWSGCVPPICWPDVVQQSLAAASTSRPQ